MLSALGLLEKVMLIVCSKNSRHVTLDEPSENPANQLLHSPYSCHSKDFYFPSSNLKIHPQPLLSSSRWIISSKKTHFIVWVQIISQLIGKWVRYFPHYILFVFSCVLLFLIPLMEKEDTYSFSKPTVYSMLTMSSLLQDLLHLISPFISHL